MGIRYSRNGNAAPSANAGEDVPPLSLTSEDCLFPETARWCLCALKNLTRPGKLSPSSVARDAAGATDGGGADLSEEAGFHGATSVIAAHAIIDAGILPLLLRILRHKEDRVAGPDENNVVDSSFYSWQSNTAQDAALYTLMNMASIPKMRRTLREDHCGCTNVLVNILNYGKVINDKLKDAAVSGGGGEDNADLGRTSLQCLKAVSSHMLHHTFCLAICSCESYDTIDVRYFCAADGAEQPRPLWNQRQHIQLRIRNYAWRA